MTPKSLLKNGWRFSTKVLIPALMPTTLFMPAVAAPLSDHSKMVFNCDTRDWHTSSVSLEFSEPIKMVQFDFDFIQRTSEDRSEVPFVLIRFDPDDNATISSGDVVLQSEPLTFEDGQPAADSSIAGGRHVVKSGERFSKLLSGGRSSDAPPSSGFNDGLVEIVLNEGVASVSTSFGGFPDNLEFNEITEVASVASAPTSISIACANGEYDIRDIRIETISP